MLIVPMRIYLKNVNLGQLQTRFKIILVKKHTEFSSYGISLNILFVF